MIIRWHLRSKSQSEVCKVTVIKGAVFQSAFLYTVNRYSYVKEEGTLLLGFFMEKEC